MTKADEKTKAHKAKLDARLTNRKMPRFEPGSFATASAMAAAVIIADTCGELYRVDAASGTIEKMRWAK